MEILKSGYRVAWRKSSSNTTSFTIFYQTRTEAERKADELRRSGEYVVGVEYRA